ncbi:MAG TPA: hypothetical protein VL574_13480 [Stellaceae bacterium]|nr:hypothetical protein [Stellaceae bacterium]
MATTETSPAEQTHDFHLLIDGDPRDIAFSTLREAENAVSGLVRPGRTIAIVDGRTKRVVRRFEQ